MGFNLPIYGYNGRMINLQGENVKEGEILRVDEMARLSD